MGREGGREGERERERERERGREREGGERERSVYTREAEWLGDGVR